MPNPTYDFPGKVATFAGTAMDMALGASQLIAPSDAAWLSTDSTVDTPSTTLNRWWSKASSGSAVPEMPL
jgi:hypothetical protein